MPVPSAVKLQSAAMFDSARNRAFRLRGLTPSVPMMQSTQPSHGDHFRTARPLLHRPSIRRVLRERVVKAIIMVQLSQHNTAIRDIREIRYSYHPWHGRSVWVHATLVKHGQAVVHCSLEEIQTSQVLEAPFWMLVAAVCCKARASKPGFASAQSLRELKEVLRAARILVQGSTAPKPQHRYLQNAGGADGGNGSADIEPTSIVCSCAVQPALDKSVVRCATKDLAIAGAFAKAASRNASQGRNRRGGTR
jgi:hypothetical protein